mmetsp:Transcript_33619/g.53928  ORF Transcript_33619/g.53928 Transcript_33619/m.53928 type:complete len:82 (-) Transcript_33619:217-462(-)
MEVRGYTTGKQSPPAAKLTSHPLAGRVEGAVAAAVMENFVVTATDMQVVTATDMQAHIRTGTDAYALPGLVLLNADTSSAC